MLCTDKVASQARNGSATGVLEQKVVQMSPRSFPVTISGNTFCASEQPSQSLAAALSSPPSMRRHAAPQLVLLEAHARSAQTEGLIAADEELDDTGDSQESRGSKGEKFLTPEDSNHGTDSVASNAETAVSHISTGASMPPHRHVLSQHGPVSADDTKELLGADHSNASAVADVVRFLASASSAGASRHADSADTLTTHVAAGEKSAQQQNVCTEATGRQKLAKQVDDKHDAAADSFLNGGSVANKNSVVPAHQTGNAAAKGSSCVSAAADSERYVRVPQSNGFGVVADAQADDPEAKSVEMGDKRRSALQKLKGRLRTRQQNAVSRSRCVRSPLVLQTPISHGALSILSFYHMTQIIPELQGEALGRSRHHGTANC